ncbi:cobalt-precorrin-6A reductase [Tsukamurella ocularis]|uniref:cobalt-precorrin-6A reductase n=1 Tax=Tsukamurella ocularis TaxID=1970234 RepID=UPI002168F405|nr:cobalt-precorrin-6A reductase [Tsukamurella ocularis]MCS3779732.1 precorrin-6A/cobalt-precorrin-6A reductase [Tsukamurella ocularis]MCS3788868.1 precorrin-6A/cobalt-precorrin-6A reductase [Tsukamurella ocularis]MCS3850078.1 precorrin-6A/cobalt-precorrin-6A reductase [Tsukamurella ocularis]
MQRVLVLGGTAEARELARLLDEDRRFTVLSSLAGRVANPRLPVGATRIGGFGGPSGLAAFLAEDGVDLLVDATHPFAATISRNAALAAETAGIPLFALVRPEWVPGEGDAWTRVPTVAAAARLLARRDGGRAMLTTGRQDVGEFASLEDWWFLIRVVDTPSGSLPPRHELLHDRGPYTKQSERALLRENGIDVLVTKNSGGDLVSAKLAAARELGIDVVVVDRPERPAGVPAVPTAAAAYARLVGDA